MSHTQLESPKQIKNKCETSLNYVINIKKIRILLTVLFMIRVYYKYQIYHVGANYVIVLINYIG